MKKFYCAVIGSLYLTSLAFANSDKLKEVNIAHVVAKDTALGRSIDRIAKKLNEEGFKATSHHAITTWPGIQTKGEIAGMQALKSNQLQILFLTDGPCVNIAPSCAIFTMPFLFNDTAQAIRIADNKSVINSLDSEFQKNDMILLSIFENGPRQFYSKNKQILTPDDLKEKKFRVMQSSAYMRFVTSMGAIPNPTSWPDVKNATETGIVYAFEAPLQIFYSSDLHKINKYITVSNHIYSVFYALVGKTFWNSLDQIQKDKVRKIVWEERIRQRKENTEDEKKILEELKKTAGISVVQLNTSQRKPFKDTTKVVFDEFKPKFSEAILKALEAEKIQ
jgi:tripartite ATP-independent transporter DctP family solute receptor